MRMSDIIEEFIKEMFEEDNELIEIQRNDLAQKFNCVPSQINYVIATRFKPSQVYYVESKRGGGGHITIRKINTANAEYLMHIITNMENEITQKDVDILLSDLLSYGMITAKEARLLKVATSDNVLAIDQNIRDMLRANILKNMLLNIIEE